MKTITLYLYSQFFPGHELTSIACINGKCKRRLFDVRGEVLWITNSGLASDKIAPGIAYFETVCHSCKTKYKVLFQ